MGTVVDNGKQKFIYSCCDSFETVQLSIIVYQISIPTKVNESELNFNVFTAESRGVNQRGYKNMEGETVEFFNAKSSSL